MPLAEILIFVESREGAEPGGVAARASEGAPKKFAFVPSQLSRQHPIFECLTESSVEILDEKTEVTEHTRFKYFAVRVNQDPTVRAEGKFPFYEQAVNELIIRVILTLKRSWSCVKLSANIEIISALNDDAVVHVTKLLTPGERMHDLAGSGCLLSMAILRGSVTLGEIILKSGVVVEDKDVYLAVITSEGHIEILDLLARYGADVGNNDKLLLIAMEMSSHVSVARWLLDHGASASRTSFAGCTALHLCPTPELASLLIERGADVNVECGLGTPLEVAVYNGRLEVLKIFLLNGADPNVRCPKLDPLDENSPSDFTNCLELAVYGGFMNICSLLIRFGCRSTFENILESLNIRITYRNLPSDLDEGEDFLDDLQVLLDHVFSDVTEFFKTDAPEATRNESLDTYPSGTEVNFFSSYCQGRFLALYWDSLEAMIKTQMIKMEAAYGCAPLKQLTQILEGSKLEEFRSECREEVLKLRRQLIPQTSVPFFDILTMSVSDISRLLRNKTILVDYDIQAEFPVYGDILKSRIAEARWRRQILDEGMKIFSFLFAPHFAALDGPLKESIVDRLRTRDILSLESCYSAEQLKRIVGVPNCFSLLESPFP